MRCEHCPNGSYGYDENACIACEQESDKIEEQYQEWLKEQGGEVSANNKMHGV